MKFLDNRNDRVSHYLNDTLNISPSLINIAKVYFGEILATILSAFAMLILIRALSLEDYANYTAFNAILILIPGLIGNGINLSLIRFSAEYLSKTGRRPVEIYFASFVFQTIFYLILSLLLSLSNNKIDTLLFGQKTFGLAFRYGLIAGLGSLIIQGGMSILQAEERFRSYIRIRIIRPLFIAITMLCLFMLKQLNFQFGAQAISLINLGLAAVLTLWIFKDFRFNELKSNIRQNPNTFSQFLSSTGWLIAYFFSLSAFQRFDVFILSHLSTKEDLANYGVAFQYYSIGLLLLSSISTVLAPKFSKVDMQDESKQILFLRKWTRTSIWIVFPILFFDLMGKRLFVRLNGVQYEKAFDIFLVFSVGIWISLMLSPLINILISRKEFKFLFFLAIIALVFNFTSNYYLIQLYGGIGAAMATILSHNLVLQGIGMIKIFRKTGQNKIE